MKKFLAVVGVATIIVLGGPLFMRSGITFPSFAVMLVHNFFYIACGIALMYAFNAI